MKEQQYPSRALDAKNRQISIVRASLSEQEDQQSSVSEKGEICSKTQVT